MRRRRQRLATVTAVLTMGALLSRFWGLALRSVMARVMGAEGIGLFQVVSAYFMGFVIPITDAMSPATSRIVAQHSDGRRNPHIDRTVAVATCIAVVAATVSLILARVLRPPSLEAREALPPGAAGLMILSSSMWAVLEGFFLGSNNVGSLVAAEQVAEVCRFGLIVFVLMRAAVSSISDQVRWIIVLTAFSEVLGLALMGAKYAQIEHVQRPARPGDASGPASLKVARELLGTAAPVSLTRLISSALRMAEVSLAPQALCRAGFSFHAALAGYGQVTGMAGPVVFIPGVVISSLAVSLVPDVAGCGDPVKARRRIWTAAGVALAFGLVVTVTIRQFAPVVSKVLYGSACNPAVLRQMAALAPSLYVDQVSSAALRGLGRANAALASDMIAWFVRLGLMVYLPGRPEWGVSGIAAAVVASSIVSALINVGAIAHLRRKV